MHFKPNQHFASITFRKAVRYALSMLPNPLRKVGSHPRVESAVAPVGHNINRGLLHRSSHDLVIARSEATKQSSAARTALDCFAALAMTENDFHLKSSQRNIIMLLPRILQLLVAQLP